jgi:RimJ/RimL family protein N-acetyltransferase
LRPLSEADAAFFSDLYGDPETMRFVGPPMSEERAQRGFRAILAALERRPLERLFLLIIQKAGQEAIGVASLQELDLQRRRVEAGVVLKTGTRERGFGKECLAALVTRAFAIFPVDEVWIQHSTANSLAERVPVSLGLARALDSTEYAAGTEKCVWSAYRQSWPLPG